MSDKFTEIKKQARHISSLRGGFGSNDALEEFDEMINAIKLENTELKRNFFESKELLGYAHQCDDYDGSVISIDKDEYGDMTVAIYTIKDTQ